MEKKEEHKCGNTSLLKKRTTFILFCYICKDVLAEFDSNPLNNPVNGIITQECANTHQTLFRRQKHVPELIDLKNKTTTTDFSALGRFDINVM